ncbi:hypothetical protein D187_010128 [Cystobacter fuscus DSM 2262]|uniref:Uncharacterized protein n=1 Tax=Cystobacter fuscus (strain ATCC 25194 / DSM 2262 / NBRC 100088 / M29) TaxID=1242864 RepID=S9QJP7_CYSF2|nr:hypothetical protein [Cystobacter fuscus]EPX61509.1 hypothetical protein D187_010128 [Cystobacter fuscus DSM 2262]
MWLWLYYHFGTFFLQLNGGITLVSVVGLSILGAFDFGPGIASGPAALSNMGGLQGVGGLAKGLLGIAQVALFALALAAVVYALVFFMSALFTACLPARCQGLERERRVVARHYPAWRPHAIAPRPALTAWDWVQRGLGLLALLIPLWSVVLLLRLLAAWNVRFLYAPAAAGVLSKEQRGDLAAAQKPAIFMLGLL